MLDLELGNQNKHKLKIQHKIKLDQQNQSKLDAYVQNKWGFMKNVININSFFAGPNDKPKPEDPNYVKKDKGSIMQLNQIDNKFGKEKTSSKENK